MKFNSVSLINFGSIKSFQKIFDKPILVLSGENGSGKSTLLRAILLAVFDEYDGVLADYINWDSDYFQVIVNFTHKGVTYESTVHYDTASDRTLKFGDKVYKGDEAKKKLKEVIDVDLLKAGMLAMEQEVAIVKTKPAERREFLKRIYDIEFKRQIADLEEDIKVSELELVKKTTLQQEIEGRHYNVPEKPEYPFSEAQYGLYSAELTAQQAKLHLFEERISSSNKINLEIDNLTAQQSDIKNKIDKLGDSIKMKQAELELIPSKKEAAFKETNDKISSYKEELASTINDYSNTVSELKKEFDLIVLERLPAFDLEEYDSVSQDLNVKKHKLKELESVTDICPTCGQSIASPEHIAKRKKEIDELGKSLVVLNNEFEVLVQQKAERERVEKSNLEKENTKKNLQQQLALLEEKHKATCANINAQINVLKNTLDGLDTKFATETKALEDIIKSTENNINDLIKQQQGNAEKLEALNAELQKLKLDGIQPSSIDKIKEKIKKLEFDIRAYEDVVSRRAEIEKMEKQIAEQKGKDEKQLEEVRTEIQVLNQMIGNYKMEIKILKTEFPVFVISHVIKDIERSMNNFLKRTYPKYQVEVVDKKNALHIVYGSKKKDVSSASGYEKQIFSLAFMYAISHAVGNSCMILDEADSAGSDKNSGIFYKVLGDTVGHELSQLILVSHKKSTRDLLEFDYGAEVLTFENGVAA